MTRPVAVIAGNYRQYMHWCQENGIHPWSGPAFYATVDNLQRRSQVDVVRTGTWQFRRDLADIEDTLRFVNRVCTADHVSKVVFVRDDMLYRGECTCGAYMYFPTGLLASDWVDQHGHP